MRPTLVLLVAVLHAGNANASPEWCVQLQAQPSAPYLVREVDGSWQLLARRPSAEGARAAVASAKGSLAAHLAGGRDRGVTWSGATWTGPVRCGNFQALLLAVPAASVTLEQQIEPIDLDEPEVSQLVERRLQGTATAAELLRLAGYYKFAGDSAEAARLAAQAREK